MLPLRRQVEALDWKEVLFKWGQPSEPAHTLQCMRPDTRSPSALALALSSHLPSYRSFQGLSSHFGDFGVLRVRVWTKGHTQPSFTPGLGPVVPEPLGSLGSLTLCPSTPVMMVSTSEHQRCWPSWGVLPTLWRPLLHSFVLSRGTSVLYSLVWAAGQPKPSRLHAWQQTLGQLRPFSSRCPLSLVDSVV